MAEKFKLKATIGLRTMISIMGTCIIGSGIFMTPGSILNNVGSIGMFFLIWPICALFAINNALCFLELALLLNESGADYTFNLRAYGDYVGYTVIIGKMLIIKPGSLLLNTYSIGLISRGKYLR